jgi:SAM-dependent methyltransferase
MVLKFQTPEVSDYFQWDVENWSNAITLWQHAIDERGKNLNCLEIGARDGGLTLWLAWQGNTVVCSDLQSPESTALPLHKKYGVEHRVTYASIDATNIPYENHFDVIIMKSILGVIGGFGNYTKQQDVIASAHKALKPGGVLLFAENLKGSVLHTLGRRVFTNWGHYWRYLTAKELKALLSPFQKSEIHTLGFLGTFGRSEKARQILGKTDGLLFNRPIFKHAHYIGYGIAVK